MSSDWRKNSAEKLAIVLLGHENRALDERFLA